MNALLMAGASATPAIVAQITTVIIAFAVVVWILKIYAWDPVLKVLDDRKAEVVDQFDSIDKKLADANTFLKEYEEKLRHIDEEARERQNKAIDEGRRMAAELVEGARKDAEEITEKARVAMQMELDKARIELRRDVVEMTLAATGKLLDATLDDARHRALVEQFVDELGKRGA